MPSSRSGDLANSVLGRLQPDVDFDITAERPNKTKEPSERKPRKPTSVKSRDVGLSELHSRARTPQAVRGRQLKSRTVWPLLASSSPLFRRPLGDELFVESLRLFEPEVARLHVRELRIPCRQAQIANERLDLAARGNLRG